jgi:hypothetical protein
VYATAGPHSSKGEPVIDKTNIRVRKYELENGEIIRMTEEEFQRLVEYFLTLEKMGQTTPPTQSQKTSPPETRIS